MRELEEILARLLKHKNSFLITGIAKNINKDKKTLDLERAGYEDIKGVRLNAVNENENYITIYPSIGSAVAIGNIDNTEEYVVVATSKVEKIAIKNEQLEINVDKEGVGIQNDGEDFLAMILDLIGYVKKIIVVQGTGPDVAGLTKLETRFKKVLK